MVAKIARSPTRNGTKDLPDVAPRQRARGPRRNADTRTNDDACEISTEAACRAEKPQERAQRAAASGSGRPRPPHKHAVDERVDIGDASCRDRAVSRPQRSHELGRDLDVAMHGPGDHAPMTKSVVCVCLQKHRQSGRSWQRVPARHGLTEGLQRARPGVEAIASQRSTGRPDPVPMAQPDHRRGERHHAGQREVAGLVNVAPAPVRTPSSDPGQVRGDRRPAEAAGAPDSDDQFLPCVARRELRKARHAGSTHAPAEPLPALS